MFAVGVSGGSVPFTLLNIEEGTINTSAPAILDGITVSRNGAYVYITSTQACTVVSGGNAVAYTTTNIPANVATAVGTVANAQVITGAIYVD